MCFLQVVGVRPPLEVERLGWFSEVPLASPLRDVWGRANARAQIPQGRRAFGLGFVPVAVTWGCLYVAPVIAEWVCWGGQARPYRATRVPAEMYGATYDRVCTYSDR